jgi:hypothetical protein
MLTFRVTLKSYPIDISACYHYILIVQAEVQDAVYSFLRKTHLIRLSHKVEEVPLVEKLLEDERGAVEIRLNPDGSLKSLTNDFDLFDFIACLDEIIRENTMLS